MPRYKCIVEYDGTNFCGWQIQENGKTIQGEIEKAIKLFSGEDVTICTAGRTDSGVHALAQVFHFDLSKEYNVENIRGGLNFHLSTDAISVLSAEIVDENFHARFGAKKRHYKYIIINRRSPLALNLNRAWHVPVILDIGAMNQAAKLFLGTHDFTSFRDSECQAKSAIKTIDSLDVVKHDHDIIISISAKSFLHHMVRNITGTLKLVGEGKLSVNDIPEIFAKRDRAAAGPTAPACGLYFVKVEY